MAEFETFSRLAASATVSSSRPKSSTKSSTNFAACPPSRTPSVSAGQPRNVTPGRARHVESGARPGAFAAPARPPVPRRTSRSPCSGQRYGLRVLRGTGWSANPKLGHTLLGPGITATVEEMLLSTATGSSCCASVALRRSTGRNPTRPTATAFNSSPSFPRAWPGTTWTHLGFLGLFLFSNPSSPVIYVEKLETYDV